MAEHVDGIARREFLANAAAIAVGGGLVAPLVGSGRLGQAARADEPASAESLVRRLHDSLTPQQRPKVCVPWDYRHPKFGLLRTRVGNNWNCNETDVSSEFFTADQRKLVREIFESLTSPEWHERFDKQLEDDTGGFGHQQSVALIGEPGSGKFQFLLTGRHMTLRCDGDSSDHVAFGGPIFYGHDAGGFNEPADHPGNVFWPQAVAANRIFQMLDGKQRDMALVAKTPPENAIAFRGRGEIPGLPVSEMTKDQREECGRVLDILLEPFRTGDREEARTCLAKQGNLDACRLVFYSEGDTGRDGVWDNWRLEGPSFVWHFRGSPHVHVWVNIADDPGVATNA